MATWKRICCPIDFSPTSRSAADEAGELAWRFGGSVTLLHVLEPSPIPARDLHLPPAAERDDARAQCERTLESWRTAIEKIATTNVGAVLAEGDPAYEIVRFATARSCDVIVIGTRGRASDPLGSVAAHVILSAHCPVVVVPASTRRRGAAAANAI